MTDKKYALKISLVYFLFGILWILFSETLVWSLPLDKDVTAFISVIKGWLYVVITAFIVYIMSRRYIMRLSQSNQLQQNNFDELTSVHEELIATEEELRQQFNEVLGSREKIRTQNTILLTLQEAMVGLINQVDMDTLLNVIVYSATELARTENGFISLLDAEQEFIDIKLGLGIFQAQPGTFKIKPDTGHVGQVFQTGKTSIVENYVTWEHRSNAPQLGAVQSIIQVPLKSKEKVIGTLGLAYTEPDRHFDTIHVELLERFASMASIALDNAQLHAQLRQHLEERKKKEETIRAIFDATSDAILVHDAVSAEPIDCNHKAEELFGISLLEMKQMGIEKINAHCNGKLVEMIRNASIEFSQLAELSVTNKQGENLYLEVNIRKATIDGTECCLAVARDISERKKIESQLAYSQTQKLALLRAIPDYMLLYNKQGVHLDNHSPINSEISPVEMRGKSVFDILPEELAHEVFSRIQNAINSGGIQLLEYQLQQNNQQYDFEARFVKVSDDEVLAIVRDITQKKQMEQKLEYLSLHDSLTTVFNRTYFEEETHKICYHNKGVGIFICDVDGLKLINDTLGHHAGDELLKAAAKLLQSCATSPDFVARIGGDEFALLVLEPDQGKMIKLDVAIKASVEKYNKANSQLPLSLSIGWAADFNMVDNIDILFKEADNNMYREKMHQSMSTRSAIVQAMMQALEARDYITEGHADRLQTLVEALAWELELPAPTIADLRLFAKFHDIGKVGIPDSILFKPDSLTPEEYAVMRRHSEIGFRIAKSAPDLVPIADWILKHHEWWNGQGYPLGVSGEKIPLACRILALADTFDAMTNSRPYRKAMTSQEAIDEIRRCAGTQFDPVLAEVFIEMLAKQ